MSIFQVIKEVPLISLPILPYLNAFALLDSRLVLSDHLGGTFLSSRVLSFVRAAIRPGLLALPVVLILFPLPGVFDATRVKIVPLSISLEVLEVALVVFEATVVACGIYVSAISVDFIV